MATETKKPQTKNGKTGKDKDTTSAVSDREELEAVRKALRASYSRTQKLNDQLRKESDKSLEELSEVMGEFQNLLNEVKKIQEGEAEEEENRSFGKKAWEDVFKPSPDRIAWGLGGTILGRFLPF